MDSFSFSSLNINFNSLTGYALLVTVFAMLTLFVLFLRKKIKNFLSSRNKLIQLSEDYENKRLCRNDLRVKNVFIKQYHYDWAIDRGEPQVAKNIGKEILKLDKELKELYSDYQFLKQKGFYPLKKL